MIDIEILEECRMKWMKYSGLSDSDVLQSCVTPDSFATESSPFDSRLNFPYKFRAIRFFDAEGAILVLGSCAKQNRNRLVGAAVVTVALRIPSVSELLNQRSWDKTDEDIAQRILDGLVDKIGLACGGSKLGIPALRHYIEEEPDYPAPEQFSIPGDSGIIIINANDRGAYVSFFSSYKYYGWVSQKVDTDNVQRFFRRLSTLHSQPGKRELTNYDLVKMLRNACDELQTLINSDPQEEDVHKWLFKKEHWLFLDLDALEVRSKVAFGRFVSDFVVRRSNGTFNLIEIERPNMTLFRASDSQQSQHLTHALGQIVDWQRYIRTNLLTVRNELNLPEIYEPEGTLIAGRNSAIKGRDALERWDDLRSGRSPMVFTFDESITRVRTLAENLQLFLRENQ